MNKIKSIKLYKYDYVLKDINSEEFELKGGIYNKTTYDEEGRTLSEIKYDTEGVIEQNYGYVYNEQGVKIADRSWDENGDLIDDMEYDIDADGRILFAYKNYLDGSRDTITYRYDSEGRLIEKEVKTDEDEIEFVETFAYDGDNIVLHESRDENNELAFRQETVYSDKADVLESKTWNAETDETSRVVNHYDDQGQLNSVESFSGKDDLLFKLSYERSGELIIGVREESPDRQVQTKIGYDDRENPVIQEEFNEKGELISHIERKFDDDNNVTESEAIIDTHGTGRNQHYLLKYEYEYYQEQ